MFLLLVVNETDCLEPSDFGKEECDWAIVTGHGATTALMLTRGIHVLHGWCMFAVPRVV